MKRQLVSVMVVVIIFLVTSSIFAGTIIPWGESRYGLSAIPIGDDFIDIGGSAHAAFAVRADGTLVAWGEDSHTVGILNVPSGNDFIKVAGGIDHAIALSPHFSQPH